MKKFPNIRVNRYLSPGPYTGEISPDDGAWIVFVDVNGEATFWRRVEHLTIASDGTEHVEQAYVDAEIPTHVHVNGVPSPAPGPAQHPGALDFEVYRADGPGEDPGFFASLNCRSIACWGATEHEAIRGLLNYVAQLCTAGALDHTGKPAVINPRRYAVVWPPESPLSTPPPNPIAP